VTFAEIWSSSSIVVEEEVTVARSLRGWLYVIAKVMGDVNAVKKGCTWEK
jgi:hypothetical protein